jgi:hypothetical protein
MQDLDRELEGMKENVMELQPWNPDSTSYFQASGDDVYDYADGIDPYSYAGGENLQKLFDFVKANKESIGAIGGVAGGLASGGKGGECKGLFGGKLKRALGRCQDAPAEVPYVAPEKSKTGLYIGIGAGVLVIGIMAFLLIRKK